jgi:hypothetical protein
MFDIDYIMNGNSRKREMGNPFSIFGNGGGASDPSAMICDRCRKPMPSTDYETQGGICRECMLKLGRFKMRGGGKMPVRVKNIALLTSKQRMTAIRRFGAPAGIGPRSYGGGATDFGKFGSVKWQEAMEKTIYLKLQNGEGMEGLTPQERTYLIVQRKHNKSMGGGKACAKRKYGGGANTWVDKMQKSKKLAYCMRCGTNTVSDDYTGDCLECGSPKQ